MTGRSIVLFFFKTFKLKDNFPICDNAIAFEFLHTIKAMSLLLYNSEKYYFVIGKMNILKKRREEF